MPQGSEEVMATLSDKTKIPLGLAIIAIGGGALWLANLNRDIGTLQADLKGLREEMAQVKSEQRADKDIVYRMATDIAVIKTLLEKQKGK
jgi:hypothetical protein